MSGGYARASCIAYVCKAKTGDYPPEHPIPNFLTRPHPGLPKTTLDHTFSCMSSNFVTSNAGAGAETVNVNGNIFHTSIYIIDSECEPEDLGSFSHFN